MDIVSNPPLAAPTFSKVTLSTGAAGASGTATLTAGTVTVNTTAVTAVSVIQCTVKVPGGAPQGAKLAVATRTPGTSFVVTAVDVATGATVGTDTSTFDWVIFN